MNRTWLKAAIEVMVDLRAAYADGGVSAIPQELPVEAVVACGKCRLYGGATALQPTPVPKSVAVWAAAALVGLLDSAAADAENLPALLEGCTSEEADDILSGLLHARMDAWAASIHLDAVAEESATASVDAAIDRFDRALCRREDELSTLASTRLLSNFRSMLAPEYSDPLPWWLDGRLEERAACIEQETDELIASELFGR